MKKSIIPTLLIKLSKNGISYSLKRDPRSISKIPFFANLSVSPMGPSINDVSSEGEGGGPPSKPI